MLDFLHTHQDQVHHRFLLSQPHHCHIMECIHIGNYLHHTLLIHHKQVMALNTVLIHHAHHCHIMEHIHINM